MLNVIWIGLFLPLIGFGLLLATSNWISRRLISLVGCGTILGAFVCFASFLYYFSSTGMAPTTLTLYTWIPVAQINADFALRVDSLSLLMTLIITGVGFLIHVYSVGYMEHDEDYARYFCEMNLFVFFMLLLVLASNLLLLFVGWEGVGLASYLLIGYYYSRPSAAQAAVKAFVVNRIGDWGLLVGLLLTFTLFGTSDMASINERAPQLFPVAAPVITLMTLLYFIGASGKSAQLPLHTWLPDAMEGPTPVSALIHAATMVTAGVYLIVRMHPLFMHAPDTLYWIAIVGTATALFAALCAIGQNDLKRVLAYSTVSQLGYMFLACGVGAFYAAMFHLTTHAFMKALLFLSAGNVVHMMHGSTDMTVMGGLSRKLPATNTLFLIGVLAMSGIPPLAAFFSKDLILEQGYEAGFKVLYSVGLLTALLTAFYLTRAYCLTFTGTPRIEPKILRAVHEAPRVMIGPEALLGLLSIFGGFLGYWFGKTPLLESFLAKTGVTLAHQTHESLWLSPLTLFSVLGALVGLGVASVMYTRYYRHLARPLTILQKSFYIDEIYDTVFVKPLKASARFIDYVLEPKIFDGSIRGVTFATQKIAGWLQQMQSGQIRSYVAWMAVGVVLMIAYFVF